MKLTRGERDRTVILLRCAADVAVTGDHLLSPSRHTAPRLGFGKRECLIATQATIYVACAAGGNPEASKDRDDYIAVVLEAALCIEEGSWP